METEAHRPTIAVVALTTGNRPADLERMARSFDAHRLNERVIVANGCSPPELGGWDVVSSPRNLGVPGGRSLAMRETTSEIILFVDDDSSAVSPNLVEEAVKRFASDPKLGALALRVVIRDRASSLKRWVPAHAPVGPDGLADAATFPGNGHLVRRAAVESVGGWMDELFFKHEETELVWRLLDAGWNVRYDPSLVVDHPATTETRHEAANRQSLRNKLWIARTRLPWGMRELAVATAVLRHLGRCRSWAEAKAVWLGSIEGLAPNGVDRSPISWRTVVLISRRGRPPVL